MKLRRKLQMFVSMILTFAMILSLTSLAFADETEDETYGNESFSEAALVSENVDESEAGPDELPGAGSGETFEPGGSYGAPTGAEEASTENSEESSTEDETEIGETETDKDKEIALLSLEDGKITPDMSQKDIQDVFDAKDEVTFAAGAYEGVSITVNKNVTIHAEGPLEFTGNGKSGEGQSHYPFLIGNGAAVTFENVTLQSSNYDGFMKISGGTVVLNGGNFDVTGLGHGCVFFSGSNPGNLTIQNTVYTSNGNGGDSMVSYASGAVSIKFINSNTDLSNNTASGTGHGIWNQGGTMNVEIDGGTFNANGNTWGGITLINQWADFNGYDYGYSYDNLVIKNGSQVTMSNNGTYGYNNGNLTISDSTFTAENNAARDNIACSNLEAVNSTINVNGAQGTGYNGAYWVFGNGIDVGGNEIYIDGTDN